MKSKSPKQELNIMVNPEHETKAKQPEAKKQKITKLQQPQQQQELSQSQQQSPRKRQQLKRVQEDIQLMKNKINLLKTQLQKEQQSIKMHKSKTEDVIRKKINVNKIQKYKEKDNSLDVERSQRLRIRNASLRQSHQNQMQNIMKAIYLVKLDDARQIKSLSQNHRKKIMQMNEQLYNQQAEKKKKIAQQSQRAKQKYERYWKEKLISVYQDQTKSKEEVQKTIIEKKDLLKELREQEVQLLENINQVQTKQLQSKKQYLAALSLPVKDVAEALNRSKSSLEGSHSIDKSQQKYLNRINSEMAKPQKLGGLTHNFSSMSMQSSIFRDNEPEDRQKMFKVPNSSVNQQKLKIILKQLKRLEKKDKEQQQSSR